tara:strand:+ start:6407 stop:6538 length:132 start_codon:yes stop_codon:yes gene_type:complete
MSEYIAAMKGIEAMNEHNSSASNSNSLSANDVDDLKSFLEERA